MTQTRPSSGSASLFPLPNVIPPPPLILNNILLQKDLAFPGSQKAIPANPTAAVNPGQNNDQCNPNRGPQRPTEGQHYMQQEGGGGMFAPLISPLPMDKRRIARVLTFIQSIDRGLTSDDLQNMAPANRPWRILP